MMDWEEVFRAASFHHQAGRIDQARAGFEEVLRHAHEHDQAMHLLGVVLLQQGHLPDAVSHIQKAIQLNSRQPAYHFNLGVALSEMNRMDQAIQACKMGIELDPHSPDARLLLGRLFERQAEYGQAMAAYRQAVDLKPDFVEGYRSLARLLMRDLGRLNEVMPILETAISLAPKIPESHNELGFVLQRLRRYEESVQAFQRAIHLKPNYPNAYNNLSTAFRSLRKLQDAERACRQAIQLDPGLVEAHVNLGIVLTDLGRFQEAIVCFRTALELRPDNPNARSRMLFCLQYLPGISAAELLAAHHEFEVKHAAALRSQWNLTCGSLDSGRRLKVGFVSDGFGKHPIGHFMTSFFEKIDPRQFELVCYSDRVQQDEVTDQLKQASHLWRFTAGQSHQDVASRIREDEIDILFDLDGHVGSRLMMFARKPCRIQVTWMGYVGTTGLRSMDYLLADRWEVPLQLERYYQERVLRMPDGYICFAPPSPSPEVGPLPALRNRFVTFGCFNQPAKVNERTIEVWAKILHQVPGSRLRLQYKGYDDAGTSDRYRNQLIRLGVSPDRLQLVGKSSRTEMLAAYNEIDIGLDSFPYSGGLTTCEALWMGVPIVTWPGDTFASRHSLSHLSNIGITETIANNEQEYVLRAIELAMDLQHLQELRRALRPKMSNSPLCDGQRFATNWGQLMRSVWQATCLQAN